MAVNSLENGSLTSIPNVTKPQAPLLIRRNADRVAPPSPQAEKGFIIFFAPLQLAGEGGSLRQQRDG
jgi:hypothetical protein